MSTPSPLVLINSLPQVNGVNVTAGSTVTVNLASNAGVYAWDLVCIGTDDATDLTTVQNSIVINHSNNTATFTAPSTLGSAVILKSIVNNGMDINGIVQPTYSTTCGVYVLNLHSRRVGAQNETTEGDSTFGWLSKVNAFLRNDSINAPIIMDYTPVQGSSYNILPTDFVIGANKPDAVVNFYLPANPQIGEIHVMVDTAGVAPTYNRNLQGNGHNVNGGTGYVMTTIYGSVGVMFTGTKWYVLFDR